MKKLHLFTLKSYIGPLIATFFISLFVLLMQFLWKYIDDLVGKGLEWYVIAELLMYTSAGLVPMALPLAILLASIMTFGNMGEHYELTALKAAGISLQRIMAPLIIFSMFTSFGAFFFSNNVIPYTTLKWQALLHSVREQRPELSMKPGIFNNDIDGYSIRISDKNKETQMMYDFMIYDHSDRLGNQIVILADSGRIKVSNDSKFMIVTLYDGVRYEEMREQNRQDKSYPSRIDNFGEQTLIFQLTGFDFTKTDEALFKNNYQVKDLRLLDESIDSLTEILDIRTSIFSKVLLNNSYLKYQDKSLTMKKDSIRYIKDSILKTQPAEKLPIILNTDSLYNSLDPPVKSRVNITALEYAREAQASISRNYEDIYQRSKHIAKHRIEWHRKFTLSFACLIFFFIGAPLGAIIRKGGFGLPIVVSIVFFIIYYIITMMGLKFAREGVLPPYQGMWLSSVIILPLGIFLTYKATTDAAILNTDTYGNNIKKFIAKLTITKKMKNFTRKKLNFKSINKAGVVKNSLLIPAYIFALLAGIFAFLPIRMFAFIPAIVALILAGVAFIIARKYELKKMSIRIVSITSVAAMLVAASFSLFSTKKVATDEKFQQKLENIQSETENEIDKLLENENIEDLTNAEENIEIIPEKDSTDKVVEKDTTKTNDVEDLLKEENIDDLLEEEDIDELLEEEDIGNL